MLPQVRLPDDFEGLRRNRVEFDRESFHSRLAGALVTRARAIGTASFQAGLYRLDERDGGGRATCDRRLDTWSVRLFRAPTPGRWHFDVEAINQTGTISANLRPDAARLPVRAWFVHGSVGYTFAHPWRPKLTLEYGHASGDGRGRAFGRFDTFYGMRRPDLGPAGPYNAMGRTSELSPAVRLEVAPGNRIDGFVSWREHWLASRFDAFSTTGGRDPSGRAGRYAGAQYDFRLRWWAVPEMIRLEDTFIYLDKGRFYRLVPNAPRCGDTRYLSLSASVFFR